MKIYFEPVNTLQWNIFEKVSMPNHVEPFLAVKSMNYGDKMLLHVGAQDRRYQSGIFAVGTIVKEPYILTDSPEDYCNNKLTVDVRIEKLVYGEPLMSHEKCKEYIHQFRTVHMIAPENWTELEYLL